ncbi:hypothetical protein GUJ93_ZPchr0008g13187 [Zizania palustris]|uniref:Uncharacterized protein n=1 Tax=Zizania palustris TaxID=103762 RepID=A0A8J5UXA0_ZIZPA|nr:hypothetical protein GUJ93_ZPchr0008g13187 [Zizania palustris]
MASSLLAARVVTPPHASPARRRSPLLPFAALWCRRLDAGLAHHFGSTPARRLLPLCATPRRLRRFGAPGLRRGLGAALLRRGLGAALLRRGLGRWALHCCSRFALPKSRF